MRVALLRTGVVLGRAGGALARMRPPFELGLGGPLGSGRQYVPWIHLHDLVKIIAVALVDERYRGPVNGVAPEEATSRAFARALGRALHRPAILPLPALALRVIFGEAPPCCWRASAWRLGRFEIGSSPSTSRRWTWRSRTSSGARHHDLARAVAARRGRGGSLRAADRDGHRCAARETFAFFSKAANLGLITPAAMAFSIQGQGPPMVQGARIDYHVRVGGLPVRWRSRITTWEPGRRFVDRQEVGPYRVWWHEHSFEADGERTVMQDRVYYAPPLGILGRVAHRLFIGRILRKIFQYEQT